MPKPGIIDIGSMRDRMQYMLDRQLKLQRSMHQDTPPAELKPDGHRMNYIRTMVLACTDELHEALAETGWKPWATSTHMNTEAYQSELADAFMFLMNLMLAGDMSMDQLFAAVVRAQEKTANRLAEGYDGVSTKCRGCKRALDDDGIHCTIAWCSSDSLEAGSQAPEWWDDRDNLCPSCGSRYGVAGVRCLPEDASSTDIPGAAIPFPRWCAKANRHVTSKGLPVQ